MKPQGQATREGVCGKDCRIDRILFRNSRTSRLARQTGRIEGFTILEIIIVLFLLVGVLTMVIPRFAVGESLSTAGRKFIGAIRSLQGMAAASQKPVKLYIDLDQGAYWAVMLEGKEEKPPSDAVWATPRNLPETIRFTDISIGQITRGSGRIDLVLYPTGKIDPGTFHLTDASNSVLAIAIEPLTGAIRTSDERIEVTRKPAIPDRVKTLLQPVTNQGGISVFGGR